MWTVIQAQQISVGAAIGIGVGVAVVVLALFGLAAAMLAGVTRRPRKVADSPDDAARDRAAASSPSGLTFADMPVRPRPAPPLTPPLPPTEEVPMGTLPDPSPDDVAEPAPADPLADRLLLPPPVVMHEGRELVLLVWLRLMTEGQQDPLVRQIVADFYTACLTDPVIAGYFPGGHGLGQLRGHFARAFVDLASRGLYASTANFLAVRHANIRNAQTGQPITGDAYDRVIRHLEDTLRLHQVPATPECLGRILSMTDAARPLIVFEDATAGTAST